MFSRQPSAVAFMLPRCAPPRRSLLLVCSLLASCWCVPFAQGYWILTQSPLVIERLDPVMTPGEVSTHVHVVNGGSNFHADYSYDNLRQSGCTTGPISTDLSNYWAPQLYYVSPDQSNFTAIPSYTRVYYLQRPGPLNQPIIAFPEGLQMMAGNPNRRTFNASSFADQAITFVCLDYYNDHTGDPAWAERNSFFEHNCPDGMRAQFFFPSCWDGVSLYAADMSHMSYPIQDSSSGDCPPSHPIHFVSLFYEYVFSVDNFPWNKNNITWALSNGDTTGYGFHADFTMGWDSAFLQKAIDDPTCGLSTGGDPSLCATFQPFISTAGSACKPAMLVLDEDVGLTTAIPALPGCNPLWFGTGPKPTCTVTPPEPAYIPAAVPLPSNWVKQSCVREGTTGRALMGAFFTNASMTNALCASLCTEMRQPYAGTEFGDQCFCGWALSNGAGGEPLEPGNCSVQCAGNYLENCGGASTLNLMFNAIITGTPLQQGWRSAGCLADSSTGTRLFNGASMSQTNLTQNSCISFCGALNYTYAGAEYSQQCFCSNTFNSSGLLATSECDMACGGDTSVTCGGPNRLSVFTSRPLPTTTTTHLSAATHSAPSLYLLAALLVAANTILAPRFSQ